MKHFNTATVRSLRWLAPLLMLPLLGACVGYPVLPGYRTGGVYGYPAYGYGYGYDRQYDTYGSYGYPYGSNYSRYSYPYGYSYGYAQPYVYNDYDYYYYEDDDHDHDHHHRHDGHHGDHVYARPRPPNNRPPANHPPSNTVTVWPGLSVDRRDLPPANHPASEPSRGQVYRKPPPQPRPVPQAAVIKPHPQLAAPPPRAENQRQPVKKESPLASVVRAEKRGN